MAIRALQFAHPGESAPVSTSIATERASVVSRQFKAKDLAIAISGMEKCHRKANLMTTNIARYQRIARYYDWLDGPFERKRYQPLRPLLFDGLSGALLDAGIGTGRNCSFYPPDATVSGIDSSPAMLMVARERCPALAVSGQLHEMDVTDLRFPAGSFDAAVASFLFCVLPDHLQVTALRELRRVVKPGGTIRLMEYVRPRGMVRRLLSHLWQPWIAWAYGASFDRRTEQHVPAAGLELVDSRYVADDLIKLLTLRVADA